MIQQPLFTPDSDWRPPEVLPDFESADMIAIDTETNDPDLEDSGPGWPMRRGHLAGVSLSFLRGKDIDSHYFPIGHEIGGNMSKSFVLRYISAVCASKRPKIFHNGLYDLGWLSTEGVTVDPHIYDTMGAAALLDENRRSYRLDAVGKDWIGVGKDERLLNEAAAAHGFNTAKAIKKNMWRLPPQFVGPYAEQDAETTLRLWMHEKPRLENEGLMPLMEMEMSLLPMLTAMRAKGIRIDVDRAEQTQQVLKKRFKDLLEEIYRKFNVHVDIWAAGSLAKAFDANSLSYPRTEKTGQPSFTKAFLESHGHELPRMVVEGRNLQKTLGTFVENMVLKQAHNGRIHCELHPLRSDDGGTVTGRFSCSNPNLQQASKRNKEFGPMVRNLFLPEEGETWGCLDYSSQEPRLMVHYAELTKQEGGEEAGNRYRENPRTDHHQMVADLAGMERSNAKEIGLGLPYGLGDLKLCRKLGFPTETNDSGWEVAGPEGRELIDRFHEKVPFVKGLMEATSNTAQARGWLKTMLGRRFRFNQWEPRYGKDFPIDDEEKARKEWGQIKRAFTYKALNKLMQGNAADQTKNAMSLIWAEGITPLLQLHDDLSFSFDPGDEGKKKMERCVFLMESATKLLVPSVVDAEFGATWSDATGPWPG